MTIKYASIGSISTGTLREFDLLEAFADELRSLIRQNKGKLGLDLRGKLKLLRAADRHLDTMPEDGPEDDEEWSMAASDMICELECALGEFAPPYAYFGTLEGDGADFGFWPSPDDSEDMPKFDDVPDDFRGDCLIVNDHGNVTCGHVGPKGKFTEYWGIV